MTISFIPGEVNRSENSVLHGRWKDHYIIVYGSGNNLVISSLTFKQTVTDHLQTIYLESDPSSVDFNSITGHIAISVKSKLLLFKPVNEYMSKPQWSEALEAVVDSPINCLNWAPVENEIALGTDNSIQLLKVYEEYGALKHRILWKQSQSLPVTSIKITFNSNKIVTKNGDYDRLLKVWSRINYGDDNTLFELKFLPHPPGDFVLDFKWRYRIYRNSNRITDGSMANIKNIRNYIDTLNEDSDTLFTFTHDKTLRVWSTYETSGHNLIKCWGKLDLSSCFEDQNIVAVLLIDNYYLQKILFNKLDSYNSDIATYFKNQRFDNVDLLLVISGLGQVAIYLILNVSMIPPNSIQFERVDCMAMEFNEFSFLHIESHPGLTDVTSEEFKINLKPVIIPKVMLYDKDETKLSILFHNRLKNTIKFNTLDFSQMLAPNATTVGTHLVNKFQGHDKSIRKLVKSHKSNNHSIVLSILNFAKFNYLWEPLELKGASKRTMITKKFQIDLTQVSGNLDNYILDALVLNDIQQDRNMSRHLVITFDNLGYLVLWDCNELKNEDHCAEVLKSEKVTDVAPKVLQLVEVSDSEYLIISIYELDDVRCWKINIADSEQSNGVLLTKFEIDTLPPVESEYRISRIENLINNKSMALISVINKEGLLKNYTIKYSHKVEWVEAFSADTNIKECSQVIGSSILNKVAIVDKSRHKVYIWDLKAKLLEYEEEFDPKEGTIKDIDWCLIRSHDHSSHNVLLSIGFPRLVVLYTQLRYDYTNDIPTYAPLKKIDISDYTSHEIGDSLWINNGYLIIGCGNQFFIDDRRFELGSSSNLISNMARQLVTGYLNEPPGHDLSEQTRYFDISDIVRILNGPLPYYHPQFLVQLLYMDKFDLIKIILVKLFNKIRNDEQIEFDLGLDLISEIMLEDKDQGMHKHALFDSLDSDDIFSSFSENLIDMLSTKLTKVTLPLLTRHQQITLISLMSIAKVVNKYHSMLDQNGIRFLFGFKLFQLSSKQTKLNMRDINFALHSRNRDILISIIEESYDSQFTLDIVKSLGLVFWVDNYKLLEIIENIARNEFNEERDPSGLISLLYMTLNKKQVLIGLWRTVSHKEKDKLLHFLKNNFNEKRWQVAAMKNAFALLGKHRYLDAAYFFLLGDKVADCCNVINNKLEDFQLSLIVSKLFNFVRNRDADNKTLIENALVKNVIEEGNKWVNSWIFWELGEKEQSIQALIRSPIDVIKISNLQYPKNYNIKLSAKNFLNDDPALILLYNSIKTKTLNYQKGSSSIDLNEETQFLIKICSIYDKMGCDYLAVILLRNWKFDYMKSPKAKESLSKIGADSFNEFKVVNEPPPQQVFEEPDMSAFDFGF